MNSTPTTPNNELEAKLRDFIKDHRYDNVQEMVTALTALLHTHQQALLDRVLAQGVQAERISYLPEAYDMTRNWPIIQQPCYILPVAVIQQAIKELQ
jgi:ATP phosphoribosyltransferase regulatory subunit HisZ